MKLAGRATDSPEFQANGPQPVSSLLLERPVVTVGEDGIEKRVPLGVAIAMRPPQVYFEKHQTSLQLWPVTVPEIKPKKAPPKPPPSNQSLLEMSRSLAVPPKIADTPLPAPRAKPAGLPYLGVITSSSDAPQPPPVAHLDSLAGHPGLASLFVPKPSAAAAPAGFASLLTKPTLTALKKQHPTDAKTHPPPAPHKTWTDTAETYLDPSVPRPNLRLFSASAAAPPTRQLASAGGPRRRARQPAGAAAGLLDSL